MTPRFHRSAPVRSVGAQQSWSRTPTLHDSETYRVSLWHGNKGVIAKVLPEEDMPMPRIDGLGDDVLDSADLVDEEPAVEEDEVDEGYVLEEEDEELEKKTKKTRVSGRSVAATKTTSRRSMKRPPLTN